MVCHLAEKKSRDPLEHHFYWKAYIVRLDDGAWGVEQHFHASLCLRDMSMYDGAHKARAAAAEGLVLGSNEDDEAITEEELKAIQPKVTKIVEMGFGFPRNMIEKAVVNSGGDVDVAVNALMDSPKPKTTIKSNF